MGQILRFGTDLGKSTISTNGVTVGVVEMNHDLQERMFAMKPGESIVIHSDGKKQVRVSRREEGIDGLWMELEDAENA